ncbi:MAG: hypothetical protein JRI88_05495 [Deltaproteobacteria bacterium]|nr:hypothetical protein [Deltaproteobacteria bacterium]MBW1940684.1 hypothetical protein [Deltaproteobacteria bacterium]
MKETLVKTIDLENNRKLTIYDVSRKVGADTWLVTMIARVEILINELLFNKEDRSSIDLDKIRKALGEKVCFELKIDRNFINEAKKDKVFNGLCDVFLANTLSYLSHPDFPKKFVLKKFKESGPPAVQGMK